MALPFFTAANLQAIRGISNSVGDTYAAAELASVETAQVTEDISIFTFCLKNFKKYSVAKTINLFYRPWTTTLCRTHGNKHMVL